MGLSKKLEVIGSLGVRFFDAGHRPLFVVLVRINT